MNTVCVYPLFFMLFVYVHTYVYVFFYIIKKFCPFVISNVLKLQIRRATFMSTLLCGEIICFPNKLMSESISVRVHMFIMHAVFSFYYQPKYRKNKLCFIKQKSSSRPNRMHDMWSSAYSRTLSDRM